MPQLDKLTYFSQFFWLCLLLFTFYILLFNNNNGILGISRILKLRNQLLSHRGGEIRSKDPKNLEDISRKGFSTGLSYMYSSLSEVSQWCKTVDYLGKRRKITLISDFEEISGSREMERQILYLISKSSYNTSSSRITCWKNIMLTHVPHGQGSIISRKPSDNLSIGSPKRMEKSQKHCLYVLLFRDSKKQASFHIAVSCVVISVHGDHEAPDTLW
ncbi:putative ATP synthase protein YMF19 [Triticum dicoccoides]|nr:putative ATP synthase protein YMF19 [Triticum dicoccoides]